MPQTPPPNEWLPYIPLWALIWGFLIGALTLILAVLKDDIRAILYPPDIEIFKSDHTGVLVSDVKDPKKRGWFFHLTVTNARPSSPALKSRVICHSIEKFDKDNKKITSPYPARIPLKWAHHDVLEKVRDIYQSDLCDLCSVCLGNNILTLELMFYNNAILFHIEANEKLEFILEFEHSRGIVDKKWKATVFWDGVWTEDESMKNTHVKITVMPHNG